MTLITGTLTDVAGGPDDTAVVFYSPLRESSDGDSVITSYRHREAPVAGVLSVDIDPGFAIVNYHGVVYNVTVPESGPVDFWDLLSAAVAFPAGTSAETVASAFQAYLNENPIPPAGGARLVALGDSITQGFDGANLGAWTVRGTSFPATACQLSGGKIHYVRNAGKSGDTAAMMLARFDTDVAPYDPTLVTICSGTNDSDNNVPLTTFAANIKALVVKIRALGALPVIVSPFPRNSSAHTALHMNYYDWEKLYCAKESIPFVDAMRVTADPAATMSYKSGYDVDGIHPQVTGHRAVGAELWDVLSPIIRPTSPVLVAYNSDPLNKWANGMALTNTAGVANSWTLAWNPSTGSAAKSIVTDSLVPGNMQRVTLTAADAYGLYQGWETGWSIGDVLRMSGVVTFGDDIVGSLDNIYLQVTIEFSGASASNINYYVYPPMTRGVFDLEFAVPAGTTWVTAYLTWGSWSTTTGTIDVGQVTVTNLTARGILSA